MLGPANRQLPILGKKTPATLGVPKNKPLAVKKHSKDLTKKNTGLWAKVIYIYLQGSEKITSNSWFDHMTPKSPSGTCWGVENKVSEETLTF